MLSLNQIPYDLSRRRKDQFSMEVVKERPFDTIVFDCSRLECRVSVFSRKGLGFPLMQTSVSLLYTQINSMNSLLLTFPCEISL